MHLLDIGYEILEICYSSTVSNIKSGKVLFMQCHTCNIKHSTMLEVIY